MHVIRRILPHEFDDAIRLSEYAFKYTLEGEKRRQRERFMSDHVVLGAFVGEDMVAKAHVIPLAVMVNEQEYTMGGIASVATYPEHRRTGIAHALMNTALETMREEGQVLSFLGPFDIAFYRRYGYEVTSNLKKITVSSRDFKTYPGNPGRVVRAQGLELLWHLQEVYGRYVRQYNGMLARSEKWWHDMWRGDRSVALYYDAQGMPRGYMIYRMAGEVMNIKEYVYLDEPSRRGLWNFMANHDSMADQAEIVVPEHDQMPFLFFNPEVKTEIIADFMGRIVLVREFLSRYFVRVPNGESVTLGIADSSAQWNSGLYTLSAEGVGVEPLPADGAGPSDAIHMDVNTLTALLLGSQTLDFLHASGRIAGSALALERLRPLLTVRRASFLDDF